MTKEPVNLREFVEQLAARQVDLDPEAERILRENLHDLYLDDDDLDREFRELERRVHVRQCTHVWMEVQSVMGPMGRLCTRCGTSETS